ncbi:MAG: HDOD domain-containing protein [Syntrophales bacterium]|nr:HDOD domain-containing protein [Syntrophales bacterium]
MINQQIQNYIERMPGFSITVTKVMEVCNRPATSSHDLNRVISLDPVLTGKVMKLVNSAYYSMGREVTSLTHAIILLGINTVKNLALGTAVMECIGKKDSFRCLSMEDFWVHSLGVGVIARAFARLTAIPVTDQEEYFVAGLLHDLGKIPLNHCNPEEYKKAIEAANRDQKTLCEAEKTYLGLDHCIVGGLIAKKWRLHQDFSDVFHFHHDQQDNGKGKYPFVVIVSLANFYTNHWKIGSAGDAVVNHSLIDRLQKKLNIEATQIMAIQDRVLEDIDNARIFLKVATEG